METVKYNQFIVFATRGELNTLFQLGNRSRYTAYTEIIYGTNTDDTPPPVDTLAKKI